MARKTTKRILSALLCAAVLAGGSVSASAAQLASSGGDTAFSTLSSLEELVQMEPHAAVRGGNRYTRVYITIPEDVIESYATVTTIKENGYPKEENIIFNGNTACYESSGGASDILEIDIYLVFPDGSLTIKKTVKPTLCMCGIDHERTDRCYWI